MVRMDGFRSSWVVVSGDGPLTLRMECCSLRCVGRYVLVLKDKCEHALTMVVEKKREQEEAERGRERSEILQKDWIKIINSI